MIEGSRCYGDCNAPAGRCASVIGSNATKVCICEPGYSSSGLAIDDQESCMVNLHFQKVAFGAQLVLSLSIIVMTFWYVVFGGQGKPTNGWMMRLRRRLLRLEAQGALIAVSIVKLSDLEGQRFGIDFAFTLLFGNAVMLFCLDSYAVILKFINYVETKKQSFNIKAKRSLNIRFRMFIGLVSIPSNCMLVMLPVWGGRISLGGYFVYGVFLLYGMGYLAIRHLTIAISDYNFLLQQVDHGSFAFIRSVKNARREASQMRISFLITDVVGTVFMACFVMLPEFILNPELLIVYTCLVAVFQNIDMFVILFNSHKRRHKTTKVRATEFERDSTAIVGPRNKPQNPASSKKASVAVTDVSDFQVDKNDLDGIPE